MPSAFDDLIPTGGVFEDLIPKSGSVFADLIPVIEPPPAPPALSGGVEVPPIPAEEPPRVPTLTEQVIGGAQRVGEAAVEGFEAARGPGFGFTGEAGEKLEKAGILAKGGPLRTIPELPVMVLEATGALISGLFSAIGQAAEEFGVETKKRVERNLNDILFGTLPLAAVVPAAAPRLAARKAIRDATKDLPPKKASAAATAMTRKLDETLVAAVKERVGKPRIDAAKDEAFFTFFERLNSEMLDRIFPIEVAARRGAERLNITPDLSPANEMRLASGARGVFEAVVEKGTVGLDSAGNVKFTGKGFREVFEPVRQNMDDAMLYFAGRRGKELTGRGIKVPFSTAELNAMVRLGEANPAFKKVFADYQAFNQRMLEFARQSGLLNAEGKAALIEAGRNFVPFYRVIIDPKTGKAQKGSIFRALKGGEEAPVKDILDNLVRNTAMIVDASIRNRAKLGVYDMIENLGLDELAVRAKAPVSRVRIVDKEVREALPGISDKLVPALTYNQELGGNFDFVFRNGKRTFYEVKDPLLLKAVNSLGPASYPFAVRLAAGFKNVLTRAVTAAPPFVAFNLVRDTQAAFINSSGLFIPGISTAKGMAKRLARDEDYWLSLANGAGYATVYKGEVEAASNIRAFYSARGIDYGRVLDTPAKIMNVLEGISAVAEQSSRLNEFARIRKATGDLREAAGGFREITTDFSRRGASRTVQMVMAMLPFTNARLQGVARLVRQEKAEPVQTAIKGITAITLPTLALYALVKDNPAYKKQPDHIKDNHWVIPDNLFSGDMEDDGVFLIPKGFEYGAIFATIPERTFEFVEKREGKRFADAMLRIITDQLALNPIPQVVRPIIEQATGAGGTQFFTGAPIVPGDLQRVRPSEQFRPWTSETMREIAQLLHEDTGVEMSPMRAEALVRGYFGTLGLALLDGLDVLTRAAGDFGEAPDKRIDEFPIIRRFLRSSPVRRTQYESEFFELMVESHIASSTVSKMLKEARKPDADEQKIGALGLVLDRIAENVSTVLAEMRRIEGSRVLNGAEKRKRIDAAQAELNKLFEAHARAVPETVRRERGFTTPPAARPPSAP